VALSQTILEVTAPSEVVGIDSAKGFVAYAQIHTTNSPTRFEVGDALALPYETETFDAVVSGLVLNFVPQPSSAVAEMGRVARLGGRVAAYLWDYAGEMQMMRHFWVAAVSLAHKATQLDEGRRFPICQPEPLAELFRTAGLRTVEVCAIDVPTYFRDFDDYWTPFLGG
jgi:SAM-dependent methyltransferase